jgi:hypothetical protein
MVESVWRRRLRWRLRGAWQWPTFVVLTIVDALLVTWLPFTGEGADTWGALLLAGFVNLLVIAVFGPLAGLLLRRRRRDLPQFVARDIMSTALLGLLTAGLLVGGLLHRGPLADDRQDEHAAIAAVHRYLSAEQPAFAPYAGTADLRLLTEDRYRACVHRPEERLPLCFFVNTDQRPAGVQRDPTRLDNTGW